MNRKLWKEPLMDKELAKELSYECDIDPHLALILISRGFNDPILIDEFLSEDICCDSPFNMADIEKAVERVNAAIDNEEPIAIYGDYDCDGITATALLYTYLTSRDAIVSNYIPSRLDEGYGMNMASIDILNERGIKLIITVDNGITANSEIAYCNTLGIDVVVTDHHLPGLELPSAYAIVDPHRDDCMSEFKNIAGVCVAFKLVCAIDGCEPDELMEDYADLLAIGTTADIMPLISENRYFVKAGLKRLNSSPRLGIKALLDNCSKSGSKAIKSDRLSYIINPRINAAGRMGSSQRALDLLLTDDYETAQAIAEEIDSENSLRKTIEEEIMGHAHEYVFEHNLAYDRVIIVVGEQYHHGVLGIVASRLCEVYGRPVIVCSVDGDEVIGSGRSIGGFPLFDAIDSAEHLLMRFGGHKQAAGVTLPLENLEKFKQCIREYAALHYPEMPRPCLELDCKLKPAALSLYFAKSLEKMAPFGSGNHSPLIGLFNLTVKDIIELSGGKHLRIVFYRDSDIISTVYFGMTRDDWPYTEGDIVDIAVNIEPYFYNEREGVTSSIRAVRPHIDNNEDMDRDIGIYEHIRRNEWPEADVAEEITPTREQITEVYLYIKRNGGFAYSPDVLYYRMKSQMGFVNMRLSLDILNEIGVLTLNEYKGNFKIELVDVETKADLNKSKILQNLKKRGK